MNIEYGLTCRRLIGSVNSSYYRNNQCQRSTVDNQSESADHEECKHSSDHPITPPEKAKILFRYIVIVANRRGD